MRSLPNQPAKEPFLSGVLFCFLCFILASTANASEECSSGFELTCEWLQDQKSVLKWTSRKDSEGNQVVELKECQYPNCSIGIIATPWLEPREREQWVSFSYKIYGTSKVYLRLYLLNSDGGGGQHQIFSKDGNYAQVFPETWTKRDVLLPAVSSRHRLLLKGYIPYKEAYVAVKDIALSDNVLATSEAPALASPEREEEITLATAENRVEEIFITTRTLTDDLDDSMYYETTEVIEKQKNTEEERFQALEVDFYGSDDLMRGYTRVIEPNICKYG